MHLAAQWQIEISAWQLEHLQAHLQPHLQPHLEVTVYQLMWAELDPKSEATLVQLLAQRVPEPPGPGVQGPLQVAGVPVVRPQKVASEPESLTSLRHPALGVLELLHNLGAGGDGLLLRQPGSFQDGVSFPRIACHTRPFHTREFLVLSSL